MTTPSLDGLLARLEAEGPINLHVEPGEYVALRQAVRQFWTAGWSWGTRHRKLILTYFRAYTFYRELSEDEHLFWRSFHRELDLPDVPLNNHQYDELWNAFSSHPEVAALRVQTGGARRTRREFVDTVNVAWGIRVLRAQELLTFFERYYNAAPGQPIDAALMRRLMPSADDLLLRQAAMYDRIFRRMVRVVDYILDHDPALARLPHVQLSALLQEAGIPLGDPNPVAFFAHKSEHALARLVGLSAEGTRRRYRLTERRPPLRTSHPYVQARLAPGHFIEGEQVEFELVDRSQGTGLEVRLAAGQRAEVRGGRALFPSLPPGTHSATVYRHGQPTGSTLTVYVLPKLTWSLTHLPASQPLLEGQWQVGRVTLADGRFATFRWRPGWEQRDGWKPCSQLIEVTLDEVHFTLEVTAESYGARLVDPDTQAPVEAIGSRAQLEHLFLALLLPQQVAQPEWRATLESVPDQSVTVKQGQSLRGLLRLTPAALDRVVVEFCHNQHWHLARSVRYAPPPVLHHVEIQGDHLHLSLDAPFGTILHIEQRAPDGQARTSQTLEVSGTRSLTVPLGSTPLWSPSTLYLNIAAPGALAVIQQLPLVPGVGLEKLRGLLPHGLGWAPLPRGTGRPDPARTGRHSS